MRIFKSLYQLVNELTSSDTIVLNECYFQNNNNPIPQEIMYLLQQLLNNESSGLNNQLHIADDLHHLSAREQQCLTYTANGLSAKEIASVLYLSPRTVEHYILQIKKKLNVRTKMQLMSKINRVKIGSH